MSRPQPNVGMADRVKLAHVLLGSFLVLGCSSLSDERQSEACTQHGLRKWADAVVAALDAGLDVELFKSANEALAKLQETGVVDKAEVRWMDQDYWRRAYQWFVIEKDGVLVIRIASAGRDGVWENGKGDDQFVEVRYQDKDHREICLKPIR